MLIEFVMVIGTIAIPSAIGIPTYQNYLRKAALTDVLQAFAPYHTAVELCALGYGGANACDAGTDGISSPAATRYVSATDVERGVVSLSGQEGLSGLGITTVPGRNNANGITGWSRNCVIQNGSASQQACEDVFRSDTH